MKKTWKQLLGTMASHAIWGKLASHAAWGNLAPRAVLSTLTLGALMGGPVLGQTDDGVVVLGSSPRETMATPADLDSEEGTVQLGGSSIVPAVQPAPQLVPSVGAASYLDDSGSGPPTNGGSPDGTSEGTSQPDTIYPNGTTNGFYPSDPYTSYGSAGNSIGYAVTQDPEDVLFRVGRRNRDVYGIKEGFTSLGAYLTRQEDANRLWFINPRMLLTDQGRGALNLGFGQKAYVPDIDRVFSLSAWWDFDSGHEADYHQVGVSFEMLGQNMSLRSNANFVVSRDEHQFGNMAVGNQRLLDDGSIVQDQLTFTEVAYNQADVEVELPMPLAGESGWSWAGGAYFLFGGDGRDATGVKGRVESQVSEDFWINMLITNDRVFDTNVSINLEFTVPNAPSSRWWRRPNVRDHLWSTVRRYHRVATTIVAKSQMVPVMGLGGTVMRLALIDPNVTDDPLLAFGGTGTLDDPFKSVADYMDEALAIQEQFGIITVRSRRDDTDLNLNTTIVLLDGQALFGEGVQHSLDGLGLSPIALPIADQGVPRPRLTNLEAPGLDVVTLADVNQVAGFLIDAGGTASGIVGDGISDFNVNRVDMTNVIDGIRIRSIGAPGGSKGVIRDNVLMGIGLGSTRGVSIEHESGTLGLLVRNNTVSDFQGEDANTNGVLDLSEDLNMNGILDPGEDIDFDGILDPTEDLNGNGVLDQGFGIFIAATGGSTILADDPLHLTCPLGILDNTLTDNGTGLSVVAGGGSFISANVEGNIATGSTDVGEDANGNGILDPGEDINLNGALDFGSGLNFFADGSTISLITFLNNSGINGAGNGATFQTFAGGAINVVNPNVDPDTLLPAIAFTNNTFSGNVLDGMFVRADTGSIIFDQIQDSVFNNNGDDGLDVETDNGGSIFIRDPLLGNGLANNGDNGLEVTGGVGGGVTLAIGDLMSANPNLITGNGTDPGADTGAGIFLGTVGGIINASLQGTTSTLNAGSGAVIFADGGMILLDGIAGNIFRFNGEHGMEITANNGGSVITPFVGSADLLLSGAAGIPGTTQFSNDFSLNEGAGLFLGGRNDALFGATGLIDLGTVTLNRFQRQGEDIDNDGRIDVDEDTNGNGILDMGEDIDNDMRLDVAEDVNGVIANGVLDPSQGTEGILVDASDLRILGSLTRNAFIGRRPVTINTPPFNVIPAATNGVPRGGGSSFGIGGEIGGTSAVPGGLTLQIGTGVVADRNTFLDNGEAHIGLVFSGNTVSSVLVENGVFNDGFDIRLTDPNLGDANDITLAQAPMGNFTGEGIHYVLEDTASLTGQITDSTFLNNEGDGLLIEIHGNNDFGNGPLFGAAALNSFTIANSTFSGNGIFVDQDGDGTIDPVFSSGINISRTERGQFNDLVIDRNLISGNTENGIMIGSQGANQLNLPNMRADTVLITNNEITANRSDGIEFVLGADGDLAARLDNNEITNNGLNGIEVRERIQNAKDSRSITGLWTNNLITGNADDGIDISGRMGNQLTELTEAGIYTLAPLPPGTTFPSIGLVRAWGLTIGNPTLNPVGILEFDRNTISQNASDGIDITAAGVATVGNNIITLNGTLDAQGRVVHAGINIDGAESGPGQSISLVGQFPTPDDDIDPNIAAFRELFVLSNFINQNSGDGIELLSEPTIEFLRSPISPGAVETALTIVNNEITSNLGRGIDILQRMGDADPLDRDNEDPDGVVSVFGVLGGFAVDVTIVGNHVKDNDQEGIYVVQTIDNAQNQVDPSEVASNANGESLRAQATAMGNRPQMRLDVHDNTVIFNGDGIVDFPATGLVIRVGTSGSNTPLITSTSPLVFRLANFFATSGFNLEDLDGDGLLDNDLDGDGFLDAGVVTGSGISTSITGNVFDGNFGDDILFQGFTDTVVPNTTAGAWDQMMFTPMAFQADPLSRLDVIFSLNQFNSIEANNSDATIGTSPGNAGATGEGAFYANAEPVFKSRDVMQMDAGPFATGGGRLRNAHRFASRWISGPFVLPPDPLISPDMGAFAYPGMGNSTFRIRGQGNFFTDGALAGAVTLDQFVIFDQPGFFGDPELVDAFGEARGVFALNYVGEEPWGWDILEPGTPPTP